MDWGGRPHGDGGPAVRRTRQRHSACLAGPGRGLRRCRSTSADRSRGCSCGVDIDIVHVHDPFFSQRRVGRAQTLAVAQRRQLLRAHRAHPLDPGRAPVGRDLPRPSRRPHHQLRHHRRADGAFLSRRLRARHAGGRRGGAERWWPDSRACDAREAADANRLLPLRGAGRAAVVPARGAQALARYPPGRSRSGTRIRPRSGSPSACATASASWARARATPRRWSRAADVVCVCSGGPRCAPGIWSAPPSPTRRSRSSRRTALYAELIGDGERGLMFPARRRGDAGGPARAPGRRRPCCAAELAARPARPARLAVAADQVEEIYRRIAARRHDPRRRSRGCVAGSRDGARSTSTCTCTPITRRTARRRSRPCLPRLPRPGSARSRSPITTRSPVRWRRARRRRALRGQGDRRRGGQDRRAGRGDRAVHRAS